ncbi:hypothetical protein BF503P4_00059 [Bacteroides phage BF503P4]|nr:hypothetical protein BF503P4_00059 [Bacteroides phage BF503P4]
MGKTVRVKVSDTKKPIVCLAEDYSEVIAEYDNVIEASKATGIESPVIISICKGIKCTKNGLSFVFANDITNMEEFKKHQKNPEPTRRIHRYYKKGDTIFPFKTFNNMSDANNVAVCQQAILKCCLGYIKHIKGFHFKFGGDKRSNQCGKYSKTKKVECFTQYGTYVCTYKSAKEAAEAHNYSVSAIYANCAGRTETTGIHIFKYKRQR